MFFAFSVMLSYVTGNVFFILLAVFPLAGKKLFGPKTRTGNQQAREQGRALRRRNKVLYLIALATGIGILTATLLTQEAVRMALASAAGIAMLVVIYVLMIFGAARSIDIDSDDNYG